MALEEVVKGGTQVLARLAEVCGALVIGYAIVRAMLAFVLDAIHGPAAEVPRERIRLSLGRSLALGLEFLLAADILNTAVAPTWDQVGLLAAIAAIRTGLNYFLERELQSARATDPGNLPPDAARTRGPDARPG